MPKDILVANFWWNMIRQPYKESFLKNCFHKGGEQLHMCGLKKEDKFASNDKVCLRVPKGQKKTQFLLFYDKMGEMDVNPNLYFWKGGENLLSYSLKLGRMLSSSLNLR
jgi:hypothetical protein